MSVEIIPLRPDHDLSQLAGLFAAVYPHKPPMGPDYFRWRYLENPFDGFACVGIESGTIIASYAGCVLPGTSRGRPVRIGFGLDTAIHPNHQVTGLIVPLYEAYYQAIYEREPDFVLGLTNSVMSRLLRRVWGARVLSRRNLLVAPVNNLLAKIKSSRAGLSAEVSGAVPEAAADLTQRTFQDAGLECYVVRSRALLEWRSRPTEGRAYRWLTLREGSRAVAACLFKTYHDRRTGEDFGDLLDLYSENTEAGRLALRFLAEHLRGLNISRLATLGLGGISDGELERLGFERGTIGWDLVDVSKVRIAVSVFSNMLDSEVF
jgi:hypothetical protein